ncbi:MAG: hypothetical protein ACOC1K_05375 [Nanoarchaeota archaeon]
MHLEILTYGTPEQHKRIVKDINSWKYKIEGKTFSGEMSPFISEIKLYDIRVPEQIAGQVLRDLNVTDFRLPTNLNWKSKLFRLLIRFCLKVLGNKNIEKPKDKMYGLDGWFYCFSLGNYKDNIVKEPHTKEKKEIL